MMSGMTNEPYLIALDSMSLKEPRVSSGFTRFTSGLRMEDRKTAALAEELQDRFLGQYCLNVNLTTNKT